MYRLGKRDRYQEGDNYWLSCIFIIMRGTATSSLSGILLEVVLKRNCRCETCRVWISLCYKERKAKKNHFYLLKFCWTMRHPNFSGNTTYIVSDKHGYTHLKNMQGMLNKDIFFTHRKPYQTKKNHNKTKKNLKQTYKQTNKNRQKTNNKTTKSKPYIFFKNCNFLPSSAGKQSHCLIIYQSIIPPFTPSDRCFFYFITYNALNIKFLLSPDEQWRKGHSLYLMLPFLSNFFA